MTDSYVSGKTAQLMLGVNQKTLYRWENGGFLETIRTPGNKRLYNIQKFIRNQQCQVNNNCSKMNDTLKYNATKLNLSYARVSSVSQKDDLERQKKLIQHKYPKHIIISDIGSGLNLNKRGIKKIIKLAIAGQINELVIAYKDRLARFGYEMIENLIKDYSNGKIIIINSKKNIKPEEELAYDILQIMNVFVAKMNGMRKYKKLTPARY